MGTLPTVEDVARVAHVSRQTVSNVLNTPDIVRAETRARVETAIAQLGYRPHASARRLRTQRSSTIGIRLDPMVDGISGTVLDRFLHALTETAATRSMRILLFTAADPADEIAQFRRLRDGADVDAFVLTSTFHRDPRTEWLIEQGIPFVTFGRPWGIDDMNDPQHLWVDIDGHAGVRDATLHLADRGCGAIAYIGWPSGSGTGDDRRRGWTDAVTERLGAAASSLSLARETEEGVPEARDTAARLLAERPEVDAVVCASDSIALGVTMAASAAGRPALPVVGFDNTPVAAAVGFSSVEQPLAAVAAGAIELLMGTTGTAVTRRSPAPGAAHRLITPQLVVRSSPRATGGGTPTATG